MTQLGAVCVVKIVLFLSPPVRLDRRTISRQARLVYRSNLKPNLSRKREPSLQAKTALRLPSEIFLRNASEFLRISDTSAASIREYLDGGARGPNLDKENGATRGPFLSQSIWTCQFPMKLPAICSWPATSTALNRFLHGCTNTYIIFIPWIPLLTQLPQHSPGVLFNG